MYIKGVLVPNEQRKVKFSRKLSKLKGTNISHFFLKQGTLKPASLVTNIV